MRRFLLALAVLSLVLIAPLRATFIIENDAFHDQSTGTATNDVTLTITAGNLLICGVGYTDGGISISSIVWDATGTPQNLTQLKRERESMNTGYVSELWYLKNPTAGASKTIRLTLSASNTDSAIGCASFTDADASTTFRTAASADTESGAADPVTVAATSVSGDIVVDFITAATASTADVSQTVAAAGAADSTASGTQFGMSYKGATTTSTTMAWTKDGGGTQHWTTTAVAIIPTGGGGGGGGSTCKLSLLGVGC